MTYQAGDLDQRVMFRRDVEVDDGMGGLATSLQDIAEVWAMVRPMSGTEREHSDRLNAQSNYLIVIRSRSDITEKDIAVWRGTTFNLRFVKNRPRSQWLEIEAERGVA